MKKRGLIGALLLSSMLANSISCTAFAGNEVYEPEGGGVSEDDTVYTTDESEEWEFSDDSEEFTLEDKALAEFEAEADDFAEFDEDEFVEYEAEDVVFSSVLEDENFEWNPALETSGFYGTSDFKLRDIEDGEDDIELLYGSKPSGYDSCFPMSYKSNWMTYFDQKYPHTRDQGFSGPCWTYAIIASAEFYAINQGWADRNVDYSEAHLMYWTYSKQDNPLTNSADRINVSSSFSKIGGGDVMAAMALMHQYGIASESTVPQTQIFNLETGSLNSDTAKKDVLYLTRYTILDSARQAKNMICKNGLVTAGMYFNSDYYNPSKNSYYCNPKINSNHCVAIVGWDDDYPKEYFSTQPEGDGAWLIRNSHSNTNKANIDSYFWVSYYDKSLVEVSAWEYSKDFPYDNNYYYDTTYHNHKAVEADAWANVYTASGDYEQEEITQVYIEQNGSGAIFVEVYAEQADHSWKKLDYTNTYALNGFYGQNCCYEFEKPVIVNHGQKFAVVCTRLYSNQNSSIVSEKNIVDGPVSVSVSAKSGESYIKRNGQWIDYGAENNANLVISVLSCNRGKKYDIASVANKGYYLEYRDGSWQCMLGGKKSNYTGLVVYNDKRFYVENGKVKTSLNGLSFVDNKWYYFASGQIQDQYTGLTNYNGEWLYVTKGQFDTSVNGVISYGSGQFYMAAGRLARSANGLVQDPNTKEWYYVANGEVQLKFTGIVTYNGSQFYVINGRFASNYNGSINYNGIFYYVLAGTVVKKI